MKYKMLREDAHSREAETCRKRPRETPECAKAHSFLFQQDLVCPLQIVFVRDTDAGQGIGNAKRFPFIDAERVVGENFYLSTFESVSRNARIPCRLAGSSVMPGTKTCRTHMGL